MHLYAFGDIEKTDQAGTKNAAEVAILPDGIVGRDPMYSQPRLTYVKTLTLLNVMLIIKIGYVISLRQSTSSRLFS